MFNSLHPKLLCLILASPVLPFDLAPDGEVSFEETLLATIPEGYSLEGEPRRDPDGNTVPNVSRVVFSPDGRRVAYVAHQGSQSYPTVGEEVGEAYHYIDPPFFSDDGQHVGFRVGNRVKKDREKWWVLLDGEETHPEDWMGRVTFRPGSDEVVYWAQPGARIADGGFYERKDLIFKCPGKKGKKWRDARALFPPTYSSDGKTVATAASRGGEWYVLLITKRGQKQAKKGYSMINCVALSPNGKDHAVSVLKDSDGLGFGDMPPGMTMMGGSFAIEHGKKKYGAGYDSAGVPVFSPDGKHLAYKVLRAGQMGIAIDGDKRAECEHDYVFTPIFHPKGKRIAYVANQGGKIDDYWKMGVEGDWSLKGGENRIISHDLRGKKSEQSEAYLEIRHSTFSPDGDLIAFAARTEEGWRIVVGEKQSEPFDELGPPVFSADGKVVAFGARSERELWWRTLAVE